VGCSRRSSIARKCFRAAHRRDAEVEVSDQDDAGRASARQVGLEWADLRHGFVHVHQAVDSHRI
jgi:hypothetical protein